MSISATGFEARKQIHQITAKTLFEANSHQKRILSESTGMIRGDNSISCQGPLSKAVKNNRLKPQCSTLPHGENCHCVEIRRRFYLENISGDGERVAVFCIFRINPGISNSYLQFHWALEATGQLHARHQRFYLNVPEAASAPAFFQQTHLKWKDTESNFFALYSPFLFWAISALGREWQS